MARGRRREHSALRRTGIDLVGELPWGAHICMFYETTQDLLDAHAAYFQTGLEDGEYCIWVLSDPLTFEMATRSMREAIPGFDAHLAAGDIELLSGYDWYLGEDEFDPQRIIGSWLAKLSEARSGGYSGMRVSGNAFWIETRLWQDFYAYEAELGHWLSGQEMIALCTYSLQASRAVDLLDVVRVHNFSLARRNGRWEFVETPELAHARKEIARLNNAIGVLSKAFPGHDTLTHRERVALAQIIKGASTKEAARDLKISPRTMEVHRANILRKLGVRNIAELIHKVLGGVDE